MTDYFLMSASAIKQRITELRGAMECLDYKDFWEDKDREFYSSSRLEIMRLNNELTKRGYSLFQS